ncbi:MAG: signal peptidase II [bacterium]
MIKWLVLSAVVVAADQLTKLWVITVLSYQERVQVLPFFAWVRWHNEGAAFSFLSSAGGWQRYFFVTLAIGFSAFIVYELSRLPKQERVMGWVYGLILGGAIGNLIDRVHHGYVVDFVLFHYDRYYFPAFNVADSALFCGAALWILVMIGEYRASKNQAGANSDG